MPKKTPEDYPSVFQSIITNVVSYGRFEVECGSSKEAASLKQTFYAFLRAVKATNDPVQIGNCKIVMVKTDGNTVVFEDKGRYGHAVAVAEALRKNGNYELIPPESRTKEDEQKLKELGFEGF